MVTSLVSVLFLQCPPPPPPPQRVMLWEIPSPGCSQCTLISLFLSLYLSLSPQVLFASPHSMEKQLNPATRHNIWISFFNCISVILQIAYGVMTISLKTCFLQHFLLKPWTKLIYCSFIAKEVWSPSVMVYIKCYVISFCIMSFTFYIQLKYLLISIHFYIFSFHFNFNLSFSNCVMCFCPFY